MIGINNKNLMEKKIKKPLNILAIILIMFQVQFSYESAPGMLRWDKITITFIWPLMILIFFLIKSIFIKKIEINTKSLLVYVFVIGTSIFSILLNQDFYFENVFFLSSVTVGFLIFQLVNIETYLKGFLIALVIYSMYSLFATYLLLPLYMSGSLNFLSSYKSVLNVPFVDMGLAYSVGWHGLMRNQGIFREPGVFQFFILVALAIQMFYLKNTKYKNLVIIILSITLITTFSTIGLICIIPLTMLYLYKLNKISLKGMMVLILFSSSLYLMFTLKEDIGVRLDGSLSKLAEGTNNGSFKVRLTSVINNMKLSIHNPIFGNSFVNGFQYIQRNFNLDGSKDITGTFFTYIMALGYPIGLFVIFYFYKFCKVLEENILVASLLFIILFLSVNTQNLIYSSIIWTFLFYSLGVNKKNKV